MALHTGFEPANRTNGQWFSRPLLPHPDMQHFLSLGIDSRESNPPQSVLETNSPPWNICLYLEWIEGIAPSLSVWKTEVLLLDHTHMVGTDGIEPPLIGLQPTALPPELYPHLNKKREQL